jgi:hypothetical protein
MRKNMSSLWSKSPFLWDQNLRFYGIFFGMFGKRHISLVGDVCFLWMMIPND